MSYIKGAAGCIYVHNTPVAQISIYIATNPQFFSLMITTPFGSNIIVEPTFLSV